jgi:hypothetical protein
MKTPDPHSRIWGRIRGDGIQRSRSAVLQSNYKSVSGINHSTVGRREPMRCNTRKNTHFSQLFRLYA